VTERRARSGRVVGIAEGVAAAVRRRQREREPRVVLFDANGASRLVAPSAPGYDELLELADRMIDLAPRPAGRGPRAAREAEAGPAEREVEEPGADARRGTGRAPSGGTADEPAA
jgi:hypothetical protein